MTATPQASPWYLYIIETRGGRLYTGITTDPQRRLREHQSGQGARFFRTDPPRRQVYCRPFPSRAEASREEYRIKRLSAAAKRALIASASWPLARQPREERQ